MKHKMHLMCLAHNTLEMTKEAIEVTENTMGDKRPFTKTLVDCSYPNPQPHMQTQALAHVAASYGWSFVKPLKNRGVAGNWNWIMRELELGDEDILWGCDPDGRPQQAGWMDAALDVFDNDPNCYTVQFNREDIEVLPNIPKDLIVVGGRNVLFYKQLISWSLGGFSVKWLNKFGGFLQDSPQYGYCEHAMSRKADPLGAHFLILKDFYDHHQSSRDPLYQEWKLRSAQRVTDKEFAVWLKERSL